MGKPYLFTFYVRGPAHRRYTFRRQGRDRLLDRSQTGYQSSAQRVDLLARGSLSVHIASQPQPDCRERERERETVRHRSELGERGALSEFRASGMNLLAEQNHSSELIQLAVAVAATGSAVYVNQQRESSSP